MSLNTKRMTMPDFKTRAVGDSTQAVISQGDIGNGYTAAYGQFDALPGGTHWKNKAPLAGQAGNYPALFTEATAALLLDGAVPASNPNPLTRPPARPWGTVATIVRPPRSLLFTQFETVSLSGAAASSTTFLDNLASPLDQYGVFASNQIAAGNRQMFAFHPLAQALLYATTTTITGTLGTEEVGVVDSAQWLGGASYVVLLTSYLPFLQFTGTSAWTALTDHYVAQQQAAYPHFHRRKVLVYFAELGGTIAGSANGRAEFVRAVAALADYGWESVMLSPAGTGELSLSAQKAAFQAAVYDLAADVGAFFAAA